MRRGLPKGAIGTGYFEIINAKGGINGNTLKLITKDDQYDPRKTPVLAGENQLVDRSVVSFRLKIHCLENSFFNEAKTTTCMYHRCLGNAVFD